MYKTFRFIGILVVCFYFWHYIFTYTEWHFIDYVNLIFHEAGHSIFAFFGEYFDVLAGSLFQFALPLGISIYFFFKKQSISGSLCLLWVGQNLLNISVYAGDAIKMNLDLLGGESSIHDWQYLLSNIGMLHYTNTIASTIYFSGLMTILVGSILSIYYLIQENN
ncbi:MAG: hypothetical protein WCK48_03540 [bacterium]